MDPRDQLSTAEFDWQSMAAGNQWDGIDFHVPDGQTVRVVPTDGEWDVGIDIYVLNRSGALMRSATYQGPFDRDRVLAMVDAMAPRVAPDGVVES